MGAYTQRVATWLFLLTITGLIGCSGIAKPESFRQQIAYVEAGLISMYQTIGELKKTGRIDAERRDKLVAQADTVGLALDATHAALAEGNDMAAAQNLRLARAALVTLEQALK